MSSVFVPALVLVACIVLQALVPRQRLVIVLGGAAIAGLWSALTHTATIGELLASLPWDVFVILVSLGVLSEIFARSRLFDRLASGTPLVPACSAIAEGLEPERAAALQGEVGRWFQQWTAWSLIVDVEP